MDIEYYYLSIFVMSVLALLVYIWRTGRNSDIYFTLIFVLIPIANIGYIPLYLSENVNEALLGNKIVYIGGCFLSLLCMLAMSSMFSIRLPRWVVVCAVGFSLFIYFAALSAGHTDFFYKSFDVENVDGVNEIHKVYGPLHKLFYVMLISHAIASIVMIVYSFVKKNEVSIRTLVLFSVIELVSIMTYFLQKVFDSPVELQPVSYLLFQFVSLIIINRAELYNVGRSQASAVINKEENGFMLIDKNMRYIGSNKTLRNFFPELKLLRVDSPIEVDEKAGKGYKDMKDIMPYVMNRISAFRRHDDQNLTAEHVVERGDHIYRMTVENLKVRNKMYGYQIFFFDETKERQYTNLLRKYNDELEIEVDKKTEHIQEIQDKMVLGLATMVEGRDASTGGHIRRTSTVVGFLIDEMKKDKLEGLDEEFCRCVIKAAPMHDIGKIAVDDVILRKPGRFTPEEFEIMKTHAAKGAVLVHDILKDVEEPRFQEIAENVAHYHHERWDGSGYPDGLKGEEIPLEARIMAIADVYDALVSKRCYKEKMSFEQAYNIIEEGMGKHFDERLNKYFISSRATLESYYSAEE